MIKTPEEFDLYLNTHQTNSEFKKLNYGLVMPNQNLEPSQRKSEWLFKNDKNKNTSITIGIVLNLD